MATFSFMHFTTHLPTLPTMYARHKWMVKRLLSTYSRSVLITCLNAKKYTGNAMAVILSCPSPFSTASVPCSMFQDTTSFLSIPPNQTTIPIQYTGLNREKGWISTLPTFSLTCTKTTYLVCCTLNGPQNPGIFFGVGRFFFGSRLRIFFSTLPF